jgi:putative hydrolase of the HAD superfamily
VAPSGPSLIPPDVRAVFFDAVGTLIHPDPPASAVYAEAARRFGSRLDLPTVAARFRAAFRRQEEIDHASGLRTDEAREVARWRAIVAEVLDDVTDPEDCFAYLYAHFARPSAWRTDPEAAAVLAELRGRGYRLGIASNFDGRLRRVAEGLPGLAPVEYLVISSEVGWRKPAPAFFLQMCAECGLPPAEVLLVGDDPVNDHGGARACGLHALLYGAVGSEAVPAEARLLRWADLLPPVR